VTIKHINQASVLYYEDLKSTYNIDFLAYAVSLFYGGHVKYSLTIDLVCTKVWFRK